MAGIEIQLTKSTPVTVALNIRGIIEVEIGISIVIVVMASVGIGLSSGHW